MAPRRACLDKHRQELGAYCSGVEAGLQHVLSAAAELDQLCAKASLAHWGLSHQVVAMEEFFAARASAAAAEDCTAAWMDALEGAVGSLQQQEHRMLDAASALVGKLQRRKERSAAAQAAAAQLRAAAGVLLRRQHNEREPPLFQLPANALDIIAAKMGKRARLICSKLCQAYGSPGAVLRLPPMPHPKRPSGDDAHHSFAPYASALSAWRYPVQRLSLQHVTVLLDGPACSALAEALPELRQLECRMLDPTRIAATPAPPLAPRPASSSLATPETQHGPPQTLQHLETLHVTESPRALSRLTAYAPHLRTLHVANASHLEGLLSIPPDMSVWAAVASLPDLQSLHLPLLRQHLIPSTKLASTMRCLTALTYLGFNLDLPLWGEALAADDSHAVAQALASPPLLASVKLQGFGWLGPGLGPALQGLRGLTCLHLHQPQTLFSHQPSLAGCLPCIGSMPRLEELMLSGDRVDVGSAELQGMCGGGSASLRALVLHVHTPQQLPAACELFGLLPALTSLRLDCRFYGTTTEEQHLLLSDALSSQPRLRQLRVHGGLHGCLPWLPTLSGLTCLALGLRHMKVLESDLRAVGSRSSLRKLLLIGFASLLEPGCRRLCMETARQLPLLEEVELGSCQWSGEEVALLLPPPERLKRVVLVVPVSPVSSTSDAKDVLRGQDAVKQLERYGVDVSVA